MGRFEGIGRRFLIDFVQRYGPQQKRNRRKGAWFFITGILAHEKQEGIEHISTLTVEARCHASKVTMPGD
jgi:hypothetical protein